MTSSQNADDKKWLKTIHHFVLIDYNRLSERPYNISYYDWLIRCIVM